MQTFMPFPNFYKSLNCLDYKRLGKQRIEAFMILKNITGHPNGWFRHPAVKMWQGYDNALKLYLNMSIKLWIKRGYKNTMLFQQPDYSSKIKLPIWFGDERFHKAHREALLFKDFDYYREFFPDDVPKIDYYWPV
jgi:hypothetical protein